MFGKLFKQRRRQPPEGGQPPAEPQPPPPPQQQPPGGPYLEPGPPHAHLQGFGGPGFPSYPHPSDLTEEEHVRLAMAISAAEAEDAGGESYIQHMM